MRSFEPDYMAKLVAGLTDSFGMATGTLLQADTGLIDSKGIRMTRSGRHFGYRDKDRET